MRSNSNDKKFTNAKKQCLGKRDKSSAGRLDPGAVAICGILNERDAYYTTSSCAGRCFLYSGRGIKATDSFARYRVSHDKIDEPTRYLDLTTLESDLTGGGDPIKEFDGGRRMRQQEHASQNTNNDDDNSTTAPVPIPISRTIPSGCATSRSFCTSLVDPWQRPRCSWRLRDRPSRTLV